MRACITCFFIIIFLITILMLYEWKCHREMQKLGLLRNVNKQDIRFFESKYDFTKDTRGAGYNIGDLLNIPYLNDTWSSDLNVYSFDRLSTIAHMCQGSILHKYMTSRSVGEPIPNIHRIRDSTDQYIQENKKRLSLLLEFVNRKNVLVIHVRSGDSGSLDDEFLQIIKKMSKRYKYVVVISGIHMDEYFMNNENKVNSFIEMTNNISKQNNNIYFYLDEPDVHIAMMRKSNNLLLHKGGFSAIGGIVASENIYITNLFTHAHTDRWKQVVFSKIILVENKKTLKFTPIYNTFFPTTYHPKNN